MIGRTVSRYRITDKLGEGGMGVVYRAEDERLKRTIALKFLPLHALGKGEQRERFEREAQAAAGLNHPNICTIFEIDEADGQPFIAMELVEGETLAELIERGSVKIDHAIDIAIQAARGLAAAHEKGVIHRDIKSANIMVVPERTGHDRQVKLMDFGLARLAGATSQLTQDGTTLGTTAYMSPEQAEGREVDQRADIWALGVVLYELIAGRQPFRGDYAQAVLYGVLNEKPEPLAVVREGAPEALDRIVGRALAKNASARYQSAEEMAADLRELQRARESGSVVQPTPPPVADKKPWVAIAAIAAAAILAAVFLLTTPPPEPAAPAVALIAVPFTSYPGAEIDPTFSPDGTQVAFSWNGEEQDSFDLYVKVVGSGSQIRITDDSADDLAAAWSPNGRTIAFVRDPTGAAGIFTVPPLGGRPRKLVDIEPVALSAPNRLAWTPDSTALIYWNAGVVWRLDVDSGEPLALGPAAGRGGSTVAVSPEGDQLALSRSFGPQALSFFRLDTFERIGAHPGSYQHDVAWIPGSHDVLLANSSGIFRANPADMQPITLPDSEIRSLAFSRTGTLIYSSVDRDDDILRFSLGDGEPDRTIASSTRSELSAKISPDGRRFAFSSARTGNREIWTADADGAGLIRATSGSNSFNGSPSLSPDGARIAFDSNRNGAFDIFVVDADGGRERPVAESDFNDSRPSWSRDGRWIYFGSNRSGKLQVWKVPAEGGDAVQVTRNGGGQPVESPDGAALYFWRSEDAGSQEGLYRMEPGKAAESLVVQPHSVRGALGAWSVTGRAIYYLDRDETHEGSGWQLKRFDLETLETRLVRVFESAVGSSSPISVAPDETWGLYMQAEVTGADLMLIEDFRLGAE